MTTNEQTIIRNLSASLRELLDFIENDHANRGKATTDEEWKRNVREYRRTVAEVSIGRSYVPEATANLARARGLILQAESILNAEMIK